MPDTIKIIDLGECTTLITLGFNLLRLEQSDAGRHKIFIFEKMHPYSSTVTVEGIVEEYYRRKLQVDAFAFFKAVKEIKSRIHDHNEIMKGSS